MLASLQSSSRVHFHATAAHVLEPPPRRCAAVQSSPRMKRPHGERLLNPIVARLPIPLSGLSVPRHRPVQLLRKELYACGADGAVKVLGQLRAFVDSRPQESFRLDGSAACCHCAAQNDKSVNNFAWGENLLCRHFTLNKALTACFKTSVATLTASSMRCCRRSHAA